MDFTVVGDDDSEYFRNLHGRTLNALNTNYLIPVDDDQVKRSELHHRMIQFVFDGRNYVGPVKEVLQFGQQRKILDLGTGGGFWPIDMADEFPRAEVIGVDLAPIQPRTVPPNCTFELCDLDQWHIPYPDNHFDFIHARSIHIGIRNYPRFLHEIARILRPGGLVLLIEPDLNPAPSPTPSDRVGPVAMHGWSTLWETYRTCLRRQGIDITVPQRLSDLLAATGAYENIVVRDGNIPVGFWPQDPHLLTVGQLQWMDYELFLPALSPLFLSNNLPIPTVDRIIKEAQQDLYFPSDSLSTHLHIVYATKCF